MDSEESNMMMRHWRWTSWRGPVVKKMVLVSLEHIEKYCSPGMEVTLPSYTFTEYKAHSSKVWPDRNRYVLSKQSLAHTPLPGATLSSAEHHSVAPVKVYSTMNTLQTLQKSGEFPGAQT